MKKFLSFFAAIVVAITMFSSCNQSPANQLMNAIEAKDMVKVKTLTDQLYNDKANTDTESLACALTGLFTVAGDAYGNNDTEKGDLYRERFNEVYDLVMARPDADKVLGKDGKEALEMVKGLMGLFDLMGGAADGDGAGLFQDAEAVEAE